MTALIVVGSIIGYLLVGAFYARSQATACYRRAKDEWRYEDMVRESVVAMMIWRALAWPYAVIFDAIRGDVSSWFMAPINDRKKRAEQLREDANAWRTKQWNGTPTEREMAAELARLCEDRAREVDL